MKTIPRKFYTDDEEPDICRNSFIDNLALHLYRARRTKVSPSEVAEYLIGDAPEIFAEPEEIFDFDASLFPDHHTIYFHFPTNRLGDFEIMYVIQRVGEEMLCQMMAAVDELSFYTYPLNLSRIQFEMNNHCENYDLIPEVWETDSNRFDLVLSFIAPAKGNMLQTFNEAWAKLETLYYQSRNKIIKEVKEME